MGGYHDLSQSTRRNPPAIGEGGEAVYYPSWGYESHVHPINAKWTDLGNTIHHTMILPSKLNGWTQGIGHYGCI